MLWVDGELTSRKPITSKFIGEMEKEAILLVASGRTTTVTLEVKGELAELAWNLGDYEDFGYSFFRESDFGGTGLYVWEGKVQVFEDGEPKPSSEWDYSEDLVAAGGWSLEQDGPSRIRRPTLDDGWVCLQLTGRLENGHH